MGPRDDITKRATDKRGANRTTTQHKAEQGEGDGQGQGEHKGDGTLEERSPEASPFFLTASKAAGSTWTGQ